MPSSAMIADLNAEFAPFRILTGIEVDINADGTLDQEEELLAELDVVVASVHSRLRDPADVMTPRMVRAIANPHVDVLGHCTGRLVMGERGTRPPSTFDADIVFAACSQFDVAVEINSRPERRDPPRDLLRLGGRDRLPVLDRHRRSRARSIVLAGLRMRACRGVRGAGRPGGQHLAGRGVARVDAPAPLRRA